MFPEANDRESEVFSIIIVTLLKGPIYATEKPHIWAKLLEQRIQVGGYLEIMGLSVYIDESEGFAFIRQIEQAQGSEGKAQLLQKRTMGFGLSVLCMLLRKWLAEHDTQAGEIRAIIQRNTIHRELELFLPIEKSEKKRTDRINRYIDNAISLGLMKGLKGNADIFEIMRITKALINADWLGSMDEQLESYRQVKSSTYGDEIDE